MRPKIAKTQSMQLKILFYGTVKKQNKVLRQGYHTKDFNVISGL